MGKINITPRTIAASGSKHAAASCDAKDQFRAAHGLRPAWAAACCVLTVFCGAAQAIDYSYTQSSGRYDVTGHATVSTGASNVAEVAGTSSVRFEFCAGKSQVGQAGCCCKNNCSTCTATGVSQLCEPGDCGSACATCCHPTGGGGDPHQSCCSQDGPSGDICCGGWSACTVRMRRVRVCTSGSKCVGASNVKVVLCDNADAGNLCPAAGARLDRKLTVNTSPLELAGINELTQDELCEIHNCMTEVFIEFEEEVAQAAATLSARIVRTGIKSPLSSSVAGVLCPKKGTDGCADIPTVSEWGVVALIGLMLSAGTVVILDRRRKSFQH